MARLEAAHVSAGGIAAVAAVEVRTTALRPISILEIGVTGTTANGCTIGIGRPAAAGVTPSGAVTFQELRSATNGVTTVAAAWTTAPTSPTTFWRRFTIPATVGAGVTWTWPPGGLMVPGGQTMVVYLITAPGVSNPLNVYFVIDEPAQDTV
jgi:hypothetical protein